MLSTGPNKLKLKWLTSTLVVIAIVIGTLLKILMPLPTDYYIVLLFNMVGTVLLASAFEPQIPPHGSGGWWDSLKWAVHEFLQYGSPPGFNFLRFYVGLFLLLVGIMASAVLSSCAGESSHPGGAVRQSVGATRAWIIWEETTIYGPKANVQWDIRGSATEFENCQREREQALTRTIDSLRSLQQRGRELGGVEDFRRDDDGTIWINTPLRAGQTTSRVRLVCLPDTIDPRSPKGN